MKNNSGFTLVELLIAIVLTIMIVGTIGFIFAQSSETVAVDKARARIYSYARRTLSIMEQDLKSCFPFDGNQKFYLQNGYAESDGIIATTGTWPADSKVNDAITKGEYKVIPPPVIWPADCNEKRAADIVNFRSITAVADKIQPVQITYRLKFKNKRTVKTNRPIFRLVREVLAPNATDTWKYDQKPTDSFSNAVDDHEICSNVLSFNIEFFSAAGYKNLTDSAFINPCPQTDPLGDADRKYELDPLNPLVRDPNKKNDTDTPKKCSSLRIILVIADDYTERQERVFIREIWIPTAQ